MKYYINNNKNKYRCS